MTSLMLMIVVTSTLFLLMKSIVIAESRRTNVNLRSFQWLAFTFGWFGMRPSIFASLPSHSKEYFSLLLKGVSRIAFGFCLLYASVVVQRYPVTQKIYLPQLLLLAGLSFILHFGVLNVVASFWRVTGVNAPELFRSPYKSKSLKEFWGKRWNIAFSEMTALVVYRPMKAASFGESAALAASFAISGLLHEAAISVPAGSGYGLPMLYFLIHAIAMRVESSPSMKPIMENDVLSRIWVFALLIVPMPILFHPAFIEKVAVPLRGAVLGLVF